MKPKSQPCKLQVIFAIDQYLNATKMDSRVGELRSVMKCLALLAILLPVDGTKHSFENTITVDDRASLRAVRLRVNDIAHTRVVLRELIIQIFQVLGCLWVVANLEELDAYLPWYSSNGIKALGNILTCLVDRIVSLAIGDDDQVDRFRLLAAFAAEDVGVQDRVHFRCEHGDASWLGHREDLSHCATGLYVFEALPLVDEMDIDTVFIVLYADVDDRFECTFGLSPSWSAHGARVIDEEHSVELTEECKLVVVVSLSCSGS